MKLKNPSKMACKVAIPNDEILDFILSRPELLKNRLGLFAGGVEVVVFNSNDYEFQQNKRPTLESS